MTPFAAFRFSYNRVGCVNERAMRGMTPRVRGLLTRERRKISGSIPRPEKASLALWGGGILRPCDELTRVPGERPAAYLGDETHARENVGDDIQST